MRHCIACASTLPTPDDDLYRLVNVTSDCRPWPAGRSVTLCPQCGMMQRVLQPSAEAIFADVYKNYAMFKHSSSASDQVNFSPSGLPMGRTQRILAYINNAYTMKPGAVLDMGSGSGAGLVALARQFPQASIYGFEPNDHPAERQKDLPQSVVSIFNQRPAAEQQYDLITLFHVFEHVEDLPELLSFIRTALSPAGRLLIQVPYVACGAFDLVVADHIWHFSKTALVALLNRFGFATVYVGNDVIEKELTLLATPGPAVNLPLYGAEEAAQARQAVRWLTEYHMFLQAIKLENDKVAVYGTGPAGAWAGHVLGDKVVAYIDEDPARLHSTFNGRPVLPPSAIEREMPVVAPFPDYQAQWIARKNSDLNILIFTKQKAA